MKKSKIISLPPVILKSEKELSNNRCVAEIIGFGPFHTSLINYLPLSSEHYSKMVEGVYTTTCFGNIETEDELRDLSQSLGLSNDLIHHEITLLSLDQALLLRFHKLREMCVLFLSEGWRLFLTRISKVDLKLQ
jgi:hypothetical protein